MLDAARQVFDNLNIFMTAAGEVAVLALHGSTVDPSRPLTVVWSLRICNLGHRHQGRSIGRARSDRLGHHHASIKKLLC